MKKLFLLLFFLVLISSVQAQISVDDESAIEGKLQIIQDAVNNNELSNIYVMISPQADEGFKTQISEKYDGRFVDYQLSDFVYEDFGGNKVKVNAKYILKAGSSQTQSGHWFVFVNSDEGWLLADSNFQKSLGGLLAGIFGFLLVFLIVPFAFWLWMFIDCIIRENVEDKKLWIIVMLIGNFIGAAVYFFVGRRKAKQLQP